jgi:hypothetical protein
MAADELWVLLVFLWFLSALANVVLWGLMRSALVSKAQWQELACSDDDGVGFVGFVTAHEGVQLSWESRYDTPKLFRIVYHGIAVEHRDPLTAFRQIRAMLAAQATVRQLGE